MSIAVRFWLKKTMDLKRRIRLYFLKFKRLKGSPQSLAGGTAIGTFFGITPIIPFHTVALIVATLLTRTSFLAAMLATVVFCNPLTYVPQYYFSIIIGNAITPYHFDWERMKGVLDFLLTKPGFKESLHSLAGLGLEAVIVLVIGGAILALPFTIISYFLSLRFFITMRSKRRQKHVLN